MSLTEFLDDMQEHSHHRFFSLDRPIVKPKKYEGIMQFIRRAKYGEIEEETKTDENKMVIDEPKEEESKLNVESNAVDHMDEKKEEDEKLDEETILNKIKELKEQKHKYFDLFKRKINDRTKKEEVEVPSPTTKDTFDSTNVVPYSSIKELQTAVDTTADSVPSSLIQKIDNPSPSSFYRNDYRHSEPSTSNNNTNNNTRSYSPSKTYLQPRYHPSSYTRPENTVVNWRGQSVAVQPTVRSTAGWPKMSNRRGAFGMEGGSSYRGRVSMGRGRGSIRARGLSNFQSHSPYSRMNKDEPSRGNFYQRGRGHY